MILSEFHNGTACQTHVDVCFDEQYDIVVAGLGTAGAMAAICAAEQGARVLGVERVTLPGGTGTAGGVFGYYYGLPGGRFQQVDKEADQLRQQHFALNGSFHSDAKALILEQDLVAAGGTALYESAVVGVYLGTDNTITGVRLITPSGLRHTACKILIDATGEGEVCAMAGAAFQHGRELDCQPQPFSSIRVMRGDDGHMHMANFDAGYVVTLDDADLSRGIIQGASQHLSHKEDRYNPLLWITTIPGMREGRLIECDERLCFQDFMDGYVTPNPVAYCYSNFDSHTQDWAFEDEAVKDWMVAASLWGKTFVFPVPLETMLVQKFPNLMAVGRCLSVDHVMACALRMQRGMQKLGEAAGLTAALAVQNNTDIRHVDRDQLTRLLKDSACLDESNLPDCSFPTRKEDLKALLESTRPGEAIWQFSRRIGEFESDLLDWVGSADSNLARNSALVLGIAGRHEALPLLRQIVCERDPFLPESSRSHNQPRLLGALHLLGKIKAEENIDLLNDFITGHGDLDIQEMSHALMALLALGQAFPGKREPIARMLEPIMGADSFTGYSLRLKNSSNTKEALFEPMADLMRLLTARKFDEWGVDHGIGASGKHPSWRERRLLAKQA